MKYIRISPKQYTILEKQKNRIGDPKGEICRGGCEGRQIYNSEGIEPLNENGFCSGCVKRAYFSMQNK